MGVSHSNQLRKVGDVQCHAILMSRVKSGTNIISIGMSKLKQLPLIPLPPPLNTGAGKVPPLTRPAFSGEFL